MPRKISRFLALIAVVLNLCLPLFAQEQDPSVSSPKAAGQEAPAKLVTSIEIKGNKSISSNTIISKMKSKIGSPYQENVISDDIKRLYLMGFFNDIKIDTESYKDGVKIIISVEERPLIEKITFTGIKRITMKDEKLKGQLKSKESQYLDYPMLSDDVRTLKKMYEKIGFTDVDINYKVDISKETNKAKVEFVVVEGKKVRIKDVVFKGNKNFTAKRLLKLLKTKSAWFFNSGAMKEDVLTEDIERLKSFYRKEGYSDVTVDYEVKRDESKPTLHIIITIDEGKKYLAGNVVIQGSEDIAQKEILSQLKACIPGKVFSQEAMQEDINSIHSLYFNRGYISAQINETTFVNPDTGRVDITYNITENSITYVDKIKIKGNIKTRDIVIRRELRIKPGDRFDGDKLRRSKERLQNLGFFEEISYDTEDSSAPDKKDLVVDVKEAKTGSLSFGGGYSTVDEFVGFVELEQKNFDWRNFPYFTGGGQNLKLRMSMGTVSDGFDLSFTNPWIFDYPVSFGFDAYKHTRNRESDTGYGYDEDITGGALRLGKELSEYVNAGVTYRRDDIDITNITENATNDLMQEYGQNTVSSVQLDLTYDSRDNIYDTTKGNILSGSLQDAGGPFGGDKDFYKFYGRASHYFPMPRGAVIEVRGRIGLADVYSDSERIPIYERFFAGGAYTIRGYDERKVGPVDPVSKDPLGGNAMLIGNIEYTYPLFSFMKLAAFYDVGNVWPKIGDLMSSEDAHGVSSTGGLKSGFGLGLRLKTPLGPIMLDYGIPMDKEPGEDRKSSGKVHFSISHGF